MYIYISHLNPIKVYSIILQFISFNYLIVYIYIDIIIIVI